MKATIHSVDNQREAKIECVEDEQEISKSINIRDYRLYSIIRFLFGRGRGKSQLPRVWPAVIGYISQVLDTYGREVLSTIEMQMHPDCRANLMNTTF